VRRTRRCRSGARPRGRGRGTAPGKGWSRCRPHWGRRARAAVHSSAPAGRTPWGRRL